eukprot:m.174013 g.174013  ORF g.174013 m.174013 type:complete len:200 (-) comp13768_c0_seq1:384-983(-)
MVKVMALAVLVKRGNSGHTCAIAKDVSSYGYFQRSSAAEFLGFFAKTVAERTPNGSRQSIEEDNVTFHAHCRPDGLVGVVACDAEYPWRVAFSLIGKMLDEFSTKYPSPDMWTGNEKDTPYADIKEHIVRYQNPEEADAIQKIYKELDETKDILHKNLDTLLDRGEKLDDLVSKSEGLSSSSKMFYKQAKKTNSCCVVM